MCPIDWIHKALGITIFSKGQAAILEALPQAIAQNKPIVVPSANSQGKDFISSCIAPWFLYNYQPSRVVITAPTDRQVKDIMWAELETRFNNALIPLPGNLITCKLEIEPGWYIIGFTTKETGSMTGKAQGFHSPHVCVIASEAQAIDDKIFEQLDSILNTTVNLLIMIGNPLRTTGTFARAIDDTTHNIVLTLDALESPNYRHRKDVIPGMASYTWVEKKREQWNPEGTEDHPLWRARVRGLKPRSSIDTVFMQELVDRGVKQQPRQTVRKIAVSCDPAGMGDDEQVIYGGQSGRIIKTDIQAQEKAPASVSRILQMVRTIGANHISIECDGMGAPIAQFLDPIKPAGVTLQYVYACGKTQAAQSKSASARQKDPYENARAEMWFYAKEEVEAGREQIPDDEFLKQELVEMKYFINRQGKIQLEDKDDLKDRIGRSCNRADAWVQNVWARKFAKPIVGKDRWRETDDTDEVSTTVKSAMAA